MQGQFVLGGIGGQGVLFGTVRPGRLKVGLDIVKIDGCEGFLQMQLSGGAIESEASPVVDPVGGIGILLDFQDDRTASDGVKASGGNEHAIAAVNGNVMEKRVQSVLNQSLSETITCNSLP